MDFFASMGCCVSDHGLEYAMYAPAADQEIEAIFAKQEQLTSLANLGNLSGFVGMLTDSRSFLSYTRHDYFRRILCNLIGTWVENGEIE